MIPYEIERKYLIRYPDLNWLSSAASSSQISQTYLLNDSASERVRRREMDGKVVYTHTCKQHVSSIRRIEIEKEIDEATYFELLKRKDPNRRTVNKTRYCLNRDGFLYEIDIYPFWNDRAFMEVELRDEQEAFPWPQNIECIREVTDDKRYSNYALALSIPHEEI